MHKDNLAELKAMLTKQRAIQAFNQLAELGLKWDFKQMGGAVYLAPQAKVGVPDGSYLSTLMNVWAENVDEAILSQHEELVGLLSRGNVIHVFADENQIKKFTLSAHDKVFVPV